MFDQIIIDLLPYIAPRLMEKGPAAISEVMSPVVAFIKRVHSKGGFAKGIFWGGPEGKFFSCFAGLNQKIENDGVEQALEIIGPDWEAQLLGAQ